jgi:hypothetical protein
MALLDITELRALRGFMEPAELLDICEDAAADALRAPAYGPAERADCAADIFGDITTRIAEEREVRRHGRPADVLRFIDRWQDATSAPARQTAAMPRRDDKRVTFTALRNRAHDWRRALETARQYDALMSGADRAPDETELPADYLAAGARQDATAARRAATEACRLLGLAAGTDAAPSPVACVFYVWARDLDAATCAAELGIAAEAMHVRMSRARKVIKDAHTAASLIARLTDGRVATGADGALCYSLRDESREAPHKWAGDVAEHWQRTHTGATVAEVRTVKVAPDPDAPARRTAAQTARQDANARRRLARAQGAARGRMSKWAHGRTAGRPII